MQVMREERLWEGGLCSSRFYNALLRSNSTTISKVLRADVEMSSLSRKCWTSDFLAVCMGLDRYNTFTHCVQSGRPIVLREFGFICL
eukprot:218822-Pelagomonas_calceolata.AAC.1